MRLKMENDIICSVCKKILKKPEKFKCGHPSKLCLHCIKNFSSSGKCGVCTGKDCQEIFEKFNKLNIIKEVPLENYKGVELSVDYDILSSIFQEFQKYELIYTLKNSKEQYHKGIFYKISKNRENKTVILLDSRKYIPKSAAIGIKIEEISELWYKKI